MEKEYITAAEAAAFLSLRQDYLTLLRCRFPHDRLRCPPFYKVSGRVRYKIADLREWIEGRAK